MFYLLYFTYLRHSADTWTKLRHTHGQHPGSEHV